MGKAVPTGGDFEDVRSYIGGMYGTDLHAKRIDSLAGATLGVTRAPSLAVSLIGQALARGLVTKHAVKQVDRLLSNRIDVWDSITRWVPHQIGGRQEILLRWTGPTSIMTINQPWC